MIKCPWRVGNCSVSSSTKFKNVWSNTSVPPLCLHGMDRKNFTFYLDTHVPAIATHPDYCFKSVFSKTLSVRSVSIGHFAVTQELCEGGVHPPWLLYLCIAFGIMFFIMLIINIFLCSAMTCSCARTEVIEKEPSIIEEYDPYRSWHGSQYGSR